MSSIRQNSAFIPLRGVPVVIGRSPCGRQQYIARWSSDRRAVASQRPKGHLQVIARRVFFYTRRSISMWSILGESRGGRTESGRSLLSRQRVFSAKFWTVAHGLRPRARRHPAGCRRMSEWPQTSGGHPPNFNCELNLPGRCRTSARWGFCHWITVGFLQDLMQNSTYSGRAADFSVLVRRLKILRDCKMLFSKKWQTRKTSFFWGGGGGVNARLKWMTHTSIIDIWSPWSASYWGRSLLMIVSLTCIANYSTNFKC